MAKRKSAARGARSLRMRRGTVGGAFRAEDDPASARCARRPKNVVVGTSTKRPPGRLGTGPIRRASCRRRAADRKTAKDPVCGTAGHARQGARGCRHPAQRRLFTTRSSIKWSRAASGDSHEATISEIEACWPWLEAELRAIKKRGCSVSGRGRAQSIRGSQFKLMQSRGKLLPSPQVLTGRGSEPARVCRGNDSSIGGASGARFGRSTTGYDSLVADLKVGGEGVRH